MPKSRQSTGNKDSVASTSQIASSQSQVQHEASSLATSLAHAEKAASKLDKKELELKVNDLVQYLLIMDQKKYPIKKLDICKSVLKDTSNKIFPLLMKKATDKLWNVFGIKVIELQDKQKGCYILVSQYDVDPDSPNLIWSEEDDAKKGLLTVILSLIFMNNNTLQDTDLWHTLKKMGIEPDVLHETFGDVKKLITQEYVRQGYLEYIKQPNTDSPVHDFKWGQRAKAETSKQNILHFVSRMYDVDDLQQWTLQWQEVVEENNQNQESELMENS